MDPNKINRKVILFLFLFALLIKINYTLKYYNLHL